MLEYKLAYEYFKISNLIGWKLVIGEKSNFSYYIRHLIEYYMNHKIL